VSDSLPPIPPGRRHDRELIVGLFVLGGVAATLLALFTLTDASMFRGRYVVTSLLPNAGGIRKGDPVQMLGVNIGRVQSFRIAKDGVAVRLEIEGEYQIPSDSRVELKSAGLLAGMSADIVPGDSTSFLRGGETLPGSKPAGPFDAASDIAKQAEDTLERIRSLLAPETVGNVASSTAELATLLKQLREITAAQRKDLVALTASLRRSAEGVEKATSGPELERAVKRLDSLTERLDGLTDSLTRSSGSVEVVLGRIERGEGTLGRISKDDGLYLNADQALVNLTEAAREMRELTADIRKQPKKYLKLSVF
jgi:phospholipid/cholesterol/gamma-HCH transport system substrate-binding protein